MTVTVKDQPEHRPWVTPEDMMPNIWYKNLDVYLMKLRKRGTAQPRWLCYGKQGDLLTLDSPADLGRSMTVQRCNDSFAIELSNMIDKLDDMPNAGDEE